MEIGWTDRVRNEEVLHRVKGCRNILHTVKGRLNWVCHILRRSCLRKHVIDGSKMKYNSEGVRRRKM